MCVRQNCQQDGACNIERCCISVVSHDFTQPDHSTLSMKVGVLEKIQQPGKNPDLRKSLRRPKDKSWV